MKIAVCISNVPDTTTRIKTDATGQKIDLNGVQWVLNPWDELALTRAIELKEQNTGLVSEVIAVMAASAAGEATLRKALAVGADRAVRIDTDPADSFEAARELAYYFEAHWADIIFTGIESSDFNGLAVGPMLATLLKIHLIPGVSGVFLENGQVLVQQEVDGMSIRLKTHQPVVMVVQKGIAIVPKIPAMRGIMTARTKPLEVLSPRKEALQTEVTAFEPLPPKAAAKMIDAEDAPRLIELLRNEAKVI
ncbi:MAG: electron transfer flavoprotein beta subunit [Bacteroidales bacterium]|mgnify:CR=1 FL=1|jgi:electron transfer flavoprotein beta subunit|nr:electron transfer flavoprotein beta subunit [Bacteroidales bacterium]MDN5328905.1 electron transfer flavoprotein beta subunit [Bacteroidales bacterium]NLH51625.1 electron transfer flavoprotein beta subunit/FixA family protein [Bacteroidales bacterium]NPV35200.1 electron transfer flavoprotein beta subunit/FixA family protein [Bacteroidales bacterium]